MEQNHHLLNVIQIRINCLSGRAHLTVGRHGTRDTKRIEGDIWNLHDTGG